MNIKSLLYGLVIQNEMCRQETQVKIDEAKALYWDACKYPRKKKKALRKKAKIEYEFWIGVKEMEDNMFKF